MAVGSTDSTQRPPDRANVALFYAASFNQITHDISDARVYGGIHFRTDQDAGEKLGKSVGRAVYRNNLRAAHEDD